MSWMNVGSTLSGSRETPELHNTRMATMKFLCVASRVFHPGALKDSWKTILTTTVPVLHLSRGIHCFSGEVKYFSGTFLAYHSKSLTK